MGSALWKDTLREIRKSFGRFLSILLIVALGVAFFAGVKASVPDMKYTADAYFDEYNLQDIQLFSTVGFTDEDVEKIRDIEGVLGVHATYSMDAVTFKDTTQITLKVLSMPSSDPDPDDPDYINQVRLASGRMPQKSGECLLEEEKMMESALEVGDTITLSTGTDDDISDYLKTDTFTIVGTMYTPLYLSYEKGSTTVGSGSIDNFITILDEDFNMDYYTQVDLTVEGAKALNSYDDEYFDVTDPVKSRLESLGLERADLRLDEIRAQAQEEYDQGVQEYEEAQAQFDQQISDAQEQLNDAENELIVNQATLNSSRLYAQQETASAQAQIEMLEGMLQDAQSRVSALQDQLKSQNNQIQDQLDQLEENRDEYEALVAENDARVEELQKQLESASDSERPAIEAEIQMRQAASETARSMAQQMQSSIDTLQSQLNSLNDQIDEASSYMNELQNMLDEQKAQLQSAQQSSEQELTQGEQQIADGWVQLAQGRAELERQQELGEEELGLAKERLDKAQEQINAISDPQWIVLDRNSQYSYMDYGSVADRMEGIARVFPVFFFLVAALVCLTTMTRMVDEQRGNIGTMKALGYSKGAIAMKYLMYAFIAGILGSVLGCALGMYIFPSCHF